MNLYQGEQSAGEYCVTWNADGFPSGIYFARLQAGELGKSMRMERLK